VYRFLTISKEVCNNKLSTERYEIVQRGEPSNFREKFTKFSDGQKFSNGNKALNNYWFPEYDKKD